MRYIKTLIPVFFITLLLSGCIFNKAKDENKPKEDITTIETSSIETSESTYTESSTQEATNTLSNETKTQAETKQETTTKSQAKEKTKEETTTSSLSPNIPPIVIDDNKTEDKTNDKNEDILVIGEKLFLTQINEIYFNFDSYKDKTIVVEGMYTLFYNQEGIQNIPVVYRKGPGCCGNDGWGGFFLKYDGEFPKDNDWVKVTGTPELVDNNGFIELHLNVSKLEVLEERGAEFVEQ
ncbi:TIGR03943 family putative permease subunit [[Clostridium] colinum]|uniref:TIGR03943 family putative permease subunit n=1 Tax=[Clostridium] colinum TaxID=36835 RepID=UPI002024AC70|nr:hypothetical protein [[Clostridium] colinum]